MCKKYDRMNTSIRTIGKEVLTADEALKQARLNWTVCEQDVKGAETGVLVPDRKRIGFFPS